MFVCRASRLSGRRQLLVGRSRAIHIVSNLCRRMEGESYKRDIEDLRILPESSFQVGESQTAAASELQIVTTEGVETITSPDAGQLGRFVRRGQVLLPSPPPPNNKKAFPENSFSPVRLAVETPLRKFRDDTKGRGAKEVRILNPRSLDYLATALYRTYKFLELGFLIEVHFHALRKDMGERADHDRLPEIFKEHPHLWPQLIVKAMPEHTELLIPPCTPDGRSICWVMGNGTSDEGRRAARGFHELPNITAYKSI